MNSPKGVAHLRQEVEQLGATLMKEQLANEGASLLRALSDKLTALKQQQTHSNPKTRSRPSAVIRVSFFALAVELR
jgi:hypothetical protein